MYDAFFFFSKRQRKPEETYDLKGSVLKIIKEIQSKEKGIIFKGEPENVENINLYVLMNTENLSKEGLLKAVGAKGLCMACFDSHYPTPLYEDIKNANKNYK